MRERLYPILRRLGLPAATGLVLGLLGPFGTFQILPLETRLAYWLAVVSANWLLVDLILRRMDAFAEKWVSVPRLLLPIVAAGIAALPATGIVTLANGMTQIGWPGNVPLLFAQVLLLLVAIAVPAHYLEALRARAEAAPGRGEAASDQSDERLPAQEQPGPRCAGLAHFMARFPAPLEGRLLCLEMQDHYLVAHHAAGSEMILCRMEDAARELEALGRRVHRSWWVAEDAVAATEREGQRLFLTLTDGRRVPVGRSYRPSLKAAGWL